MDNLVKPLATAMLTAMLTGAVALAGSNPALARHWQGGHHGHGHGMHPDEAVQRCVRAAERDASRFGHGRANVTQVTGVSRKEYGFNVKGHILVNSRGGGWRRGGHGHDLGKFSCKIRYGQIADLNFSGLRGFY